MLRAPLQRVLSHQARGVDDGLEAQTVTDVSLYYQRTALDDPRTNAPGGVGPHALHRNVLAPNPRFATDGDHFVVLNTLHDDIAQHAKTSIGTRNRFKSGMASTAGHEHLTRGELATHDTMRLVSHIG